MEDQIYFAKGTKVVSRDGKIKGKTTGSCNHCRLEGCNGLRLGVRWSDGKLTFPCTKGMEVTVKATKDGKQSITWKIF